MSTLCLFTNVLITLRLPRYRIFRDFYNRRLSHHPALAVLPSFPTPRIELQPPHLALAKKHVSRAKILRSSPKIAFFAVGASCFRKYEGVALTARQCKL